MSDGYMSRQRDIITTTYRYFFAQEWKKPLNLPVERHTYEKKWPNCEILNMQILHGVWQSQMLPDLAVGRLIFHSRANKYRYIWHILKKNQNMRSELLDMQVHAFDVITSKLRCLNRCDERTKVFWIAFLIYQEVSFDMFLKRVNAKKSWQTMPPDKLAFLQERDVSRC